MASPSLAEVALKYVAAGWYVFPLRPAAKIPLLTKGVHGATLDAAQVRKWWKDYPRANIGIALHPSKLGVIDVDVKPEKKIDGRVSMAEMEVLYGKPGTTAEQATVGTGTHFVFRMNGTPTIDKVGWEHGIDLLTAKHRYIVAWPSTVGGKQYSWQGALDPWNEVGYLAGPWKKLVRAQEERSEHQPIQSGAADLLDIAALRVPGADIPELKSILAVLPASMERDSWLRVLWGAAAQWGSTKHEQEVIAALEEWSASTAKAGQYKPGEVATRWQEHTATRGGRSGAGHTTWRSIRAMAQKAGWSPFSLGGVDPTKWAKHLKTKRGEDGQVLILPTAWNVALLLAFHKLFRGSVRRNVLTNAIEMHSAVICPLRDPTRLPRVYNDKSDWVGVGAAVGTKITGAIGKEPLNASVAVAADVHAYDPIKQWIDRLEWDGVKRLDSWLVKVTGTADTPLSRAIGRAWVIGLAARAMAEYDGRGTKMDSVLVLQGHEGIGKSTVGAIMGGQWYSSFSNSLDNDEIYYTIEKTVVLEFDELDAMSRSEATRVKSLVTTQADTFRRKYDPTAQSKPRRCVFIGTTNDDSFLSKDMTVRRWWIVRCGRKTFDLRWLTDNRDQIIAEGKAMVELGEQPVIPLELHAAQRESVERAQKQHPYDSIVEKWSSDKPRLMSIGMQGAVEQVLSRSIQSLSVPELHKFGECMRAYGWEKHRKTHGNVWIKTAG